MQPWPFDIRKVSSGTGGTGYVGHVLVPRLSRERQKPSRLWPRPAVPGAHPPGATRDHGAARSLPVFRVPPLWPGHPPLIEMPGRGCRLRLPHTHRCFVGFSLPIGGKGFGNLWGCGGRVGLGHEAIPVLSSLALRRPLRCLSSASRRHGYLLASDNNQRNSRLEVEPLPVEVLMPRRFSAAALCASRLLKTPEPKCRDLTRSSKRRAVARVSRIGPAVGR